jgi:hypothetical protein
MTTSDSLDMLSDFTGERIALGLVGRLIPTPVAWECPAHDGFLD